MPERRHANSNEWLLIAVICALPSAAAVASTIVDLPGANVEGNENMGFPFNLPQSSVVTQRYQQVFDASIFHAINGLQAITRISFRPDGLIGDEFSTILENVRIDLSTTTVDADELNYQFADNVGKDNETVFAGTLLLSTTRTRTTNRTMAFDLVIDFQKPFHYDPAAGNLLLDVYNFGGEWTDQFDAVDDWDDSVSRVFSKDVNATFGVWRDSIGLVAEVTFDQVSVPVPTALWLLAVPLLAMAGSARTNSRRR